MKKILEAFDENDEKKLFLKTAFSIGLLTTTEHHY